MELSQHLKTRMAQRKLAHAYLVVGGEPPPAGGPAGRRLGVHRGGPPLRATAPAAGRPPRGIHPDIVRADPEGEGLKAEGRPGPSVGRLHPAQRGAKEGLPPGARGTAEPDGAEHPAQTHRGGPLLCLLPLSEPQPGAPSAHHPLPVRDPPGPGGGVPIRPVRRGNSWQTSFSPALRRRRVCPSSFPWKSGTGRRSVGCWRRPWPGSPPPCPSGRTFCRCWTGLPPFSGPATSTSVRAICAAGLPPLCR